MALTDLKIRKAKPEAKPYKLSDGGGLFVLVKPNGSRLWQQKYRHLGKERLLSHGSYPEVRLAQARLKREEARSLLAEGSDPSVQKRLDQIEAETQARTTFLLVAEESFSGSLRDECLNEKVFDSLTDARRTPALWRYDYNNVRPHSSLGNKTPVRRAPSA